MALKRVCICGHFGFGEDLLNGQTVKTKTVTCAVEKALGREEVLRCDTAGGVRRNWLLPFRLFSALRRCRNIVALPAENGLRVLMPLLFFYNRFFHRALHYVVIGGWLAEFLAKKKRLLRLLKGCAGIYVETQEMKRGLEDMGLANVLLLPNCKELKLPAESELCYETEEPHRLCTFTRIMEEKGIGDAVLAVKMANEQLGRTAYTLDIYGPIDPAKKQWFADLQRDFPPCVTYGGEIPYGESTERLKDYFALLFLTYYEGEGFAGTLIDAFSAAVPPLVSDWKYNCEIVRDGIDGAVVPPHDAAAACARLVAIAERPEEWVGMKKECLARAALYTPEKATAVLIENLR